MSLKLFYLEDIERIILSNNSNFHSLIHKWNIPVFNNFVPHLSGAYFLFDNYGDLIYIGKAKNLKSEISQHLSENSKNNIIKIHTNHVVYFVTDSVKTAEIIEAKLLFKYTYINGSLPPGNNRLELKPFKKLMPLYATIRRTA